MTIVLSSLDPSEALCRESYRGGQRLQGLLEGSNQSGEGSGVGVGVGVETSGGISSHPHTLGGVGVGSRSAALTAFSLEDRAIKPIREKTTDITRRRRLPMRHLSCEFRLCHIDWQIKPKALKLRIILGFSELHVR